MLMHDVCIICTVRCEGARACDPNSNLVVIVYPPLVVFASISASSLRHVVSGSWSHVKSDETAKDKCVIPPDKGERI